jgi:hypothetical protein
MTDLRTVITTNQQPENTPNVDACYYLKGCPVNVSVLSDSMCIRFFSNFTGIPIRRYRYVHGRYLAGTLRESVSATQMSNPSSEHYLS